MIGMPIAKALWHEDLDELTYELASGVFEEPLGL
jgi:hypothetical protein